MSFPVGKRVLPDMFRKNLQRRTKRRILLMTGKKAGVRIRDFCALSIKLFGWICSLKIRFNPFKFYRNVWMADYNVPSAETSLWTQPLRDPKKCFKAQKNLECPFQHLNYRNLKLADRCLQR